MTQSRDLLHLLQRYLAGTDDLTFVREYVTAHLGDDDDELVDYVSMEIWYLEDGHVTEERLRERLGEYLLQSGLLRVVSTGRLSFRQFDILEESQTQRFSFGVQQDVIHRVQTSSSSGNRSSVSSWTLGEEACIIPSRNPRPPTRRRREPFLEPWVKPAAIRPRENLANKHNLNRRHSFLPA